MRIRAVACSLTAVLVVSSFTFATAPAVELNPAAVVYQLPDQVKWQDPLGTSGAKNAVLAGDRPSPVSMW